MPVEVIFLAGGVSVIATCIIVLIIWAVKKKKGAHLRFGDIVIAFLAQFPVNLIAGFMVYTSVYYHAEPIALEKLQSSDTVQVSKTESGYLFDGPGEDTAVIFYPGAKVEYTAYAPLMFDIAEKGDDCFLVQMPFNMAFFGANTADSIINNASYTYKKWYMSGHSLGGAIAAQYCSRSADTDGLILLASYSTSPISEETAVCSLLGTNDGVVNLTALEQNKPNLPSGTLYITIEGGNHSGFACYGAQRGDNDADISPAEQRRITAEHIHEFLTDNE